MDSTSEEDHRIDWSKYYEFNCMNNLTKTLRIIKKGKKMFIDCEELVHYLYLYLMFWHHNKNGVAIMNHFNTLNMLHNDKWTGMEIKEGKCIISKNSHNV